LPDAPRPRDHLNTAVLQDKMYAAGGRCTSRYSTFSDTVKEVDVFDFKSRKWLISRRPGNLPEPRAGAAVAVLDGKIMIMGGESGEQSDAYDTVNELDTQSGLWATLSPMNHPRHGTQAIVSGRGVYIAGGSPVRGHGHQNNMEVYNEDLPAGVPSEAGTLSVPTTIDVPIGAPKIVTIQHVSGNQGVFVQSISLSGVSANDFILTTNATAPMLIGKGSSLDVLIEYNGNADEAHATVELFFSGNEVLNVNVVGRMQEETKMVTVSLPTGGSSQPPSQAPSFRSTGRPSQAPSFSPSNRPSLSSPSSTDGPSAPIVDFFINAGSKKEDLSFVNGNTWTYRVPSSVEIKGAAKQSPFHSHRSGPGFSYVLGGFYPLSFHEVRLGFAEVWQDNCEIGKRIMTIEINGEVVASDMDVFQEAGGCFVALMKRYTVAANAQGKFEISFTSSVEYPMVSLVEVRSSPELGSITTGQLSSTPSPSRMPSLRPSKQPLSSPAREDYGMIDAGAKDEDVSLVSGITWTYKVPNSVEIANTEAPSIFRSHRSGSNFTYTFEGLTPGERIGLEMGFAEIWGKSCTPGGRVMSIAVNGEVVNSALDVYSEVGCEAAYVQEYTSTVDQDGKVIVYLDASVENAMISYLRILSEPSSKRPNFVFDAGAEGEDTSFLKGDTWTYGVPSDVDISNTSFPSYFRTHRSGTNFTYTITDLVPRSVYDLSFGFAEIWKANCGVGKRVIVITINGVVVKEDLDVFREAGCESAHIEAFASEANERGEIEITFDALVEHPMVSYVELAKRPESVSNAAAPTGLPTSTPPQPPQMPSLMPTSQLLSMPTEGEILIDAGTKDEDTSKFSEDTWTFSVPRNVEIKLTDRPEIFRTHRSSPRFTYAVDGLEANAMYSISLGFSETWWKNCDIGKRVMIISINNNVVNPELDVYKEVGCNTAFVDTYTEKATVSGEIIVEFDTIIENAFVSFIRIKKYNR